MTAPIASNTTDTQAPSLFDRPAQTAVTAGSLFDRDLPDTTAAIVAPDVTAMQQPIPGVPGASEILGDFTADALKTAAVGILKAGRGLAQMVLGASDAPVPFAMTEDDAAELREAGITNFETPEDRVEQGMGLALAAAAATGGTLSSILQTAIPKAAVRNTIANVGGTAVFSAVRPKHEEESLQEAIITDALFFGGIMMASSLWRATAPTRLPVDEIVKAGGVEGRVGRDLGAAVFEESHAIAQQLNARQLATPRPTATHPVIDALGNLGAGRVVWQQHPANIGMLRGLLGSPSQWAKVGGPVGDAAGRIVQNAIDRFRLAVRLKAEWKETLRLAEGELKKDLPSRGRGAALEQHKLQLGALLDTVFDPSDLPLVLSPSMRNAFTTIRNRLTADRETLRLLVGGADDWGISAYLPHVFVGEYQIVNAGTGGFLGAAAGPELRSKLAEILKRNPQAELRVEPRRITLPDDMRGFGLTNQQIHALRGQIERATGLDATEIQELVLNGTVRTRPGKKFFANALQRRSNLAGFEADPFRAIDVYASGVARKIAFHDFEQKATHVLSALQRVAPNTAPSQQVLKDYINRVLGRPGQVEQLAEATLMRLAQGTGQAVARLSPQRGTQVQLAVERILQPRNLAGTITKIESAARLGLSLPAIMVNLSQTAVNTATKIGWKDTTMAIRTLMGARKFLPSGNMAQQRKAIDSLMRQLDLEAQIPLSVGEQVMTSAVRNGRSLVDLSLYFFQRAEDANRAIAGLAKYQQARRQGFQHDAAVEQAKRFVTETQFEYSVADSPALVSGPLGGTMFQFKKFFIKELEFIAGLSPTELVKFATNMQIAGGLAAFFALPVVAQGDALFGKLNEGDRLSDLLKNHFPRLSRGVPGLAGIDVSGSVSIGMPRDAGDLLGPFPLDLGAALVLAGGGLQTLSEAMPDWARRKIQAGIALSPSDQARAIRQITPVYIRRLNEAVQVMQTGQVRSGGQLAFTPDDPAAETALAALGFRSLDRAIESDVSQQAMRKQESLQQRLQPVYERVARAYTDGEYAEMDRLLQQAIDDGLVPTANGVIGQIERLIVDRPTRTVRRSRLQIREDILQRLSRFLP